MEFYMKLPRNQKKFALFLGIISVNIIAPLITCFEVGFSIQVWANTFKAMPFIWVSVVILVLLTHKSASWMKSKILAKEDSFNAEIKKIKIDNAIDKALLDAKAKNIKAVKALLDTSNAELLEDGTIKGLSESIKTLSENADTSFLFDTSDTQSNPGHKGFMPGQKKDGIPNADTSFETRLAEARKNGNTLEAIKIKKEASEEGIYLT